MISDKIIKKTIIKKEIIASNIESKARKVSKLYGAKVICQKKVIGDAHGCYFTDNKTIRIKNSLKYTGSRSFIKTFCHELAHHLQYLCNGGLPKYKGNYYYLSTFINFERQAERIAYYLYKEYFRDYCDIHPNSFSTYKSKYGRNFLKKFYQKQANIKLINR